ncbi:FeoA domain [uncultured Clostridium sp.]|uniref:FeoA family protein n=1 Tax=uncultured Clostridium sp. TaxID=59620 RepID=UPI0008221A86|nr:FeoA family protein [uncultured Clostridium sp.]SCK03884.1 FeoA domain [uncultured Clostridium sp.]
MKNQLTLDKVEIGQKCKIVSLNSTGSIRRRLLDLGLIGDTEIEALQQSPSGDPIAYLIRGAVIALRNEDSSQISVELL